MDKYYKPSGRFSISSIFYFVLLCTIVFPVLGLIYSYAIWYIPFIYINVIITAGFGFLVGFLINLFVIGKGKVRTPLLAIIFGVFGGLIALYFHYAVWIDLVLNVGESYGTSSIGITVSNIEFLQVFTLAMEPAVLLELISEVNAIGTWGLFGSDTISGVFLSIIWLIEILIVVVISTVLSRSKVSDPFCEIDNEWFTETILPPFDYIDYQEQLIIDLENDKGDSFSRASLSSNSNNNHSVFFFFSSKNGTNYLSIENKLAKLDDDGNLILTVIIS